MCVNVYIIALRFSLTVILVSSIFLFLILKASLHFLFHVHFSASSRDGYRLDMCQLKGLHGLWRGELLERSGTSQIDLSLGGPRQMCQQGTSLL